MSLDAFFGRIGSKKQFVSKILELIPTHKIYVEPFVGGGSVYFGKQPAEIEVINDLDHELIEGYKLLQNNPNKEKMLEYAVQRNRDKQETLNNLTEFVNKDYDDVERNLLKKFYISRCTYACKNWGNLYIPNTSLKKISKTDLYYNRLKDTIILNNDYGDVIKKYDSDDTFFYLDPPYEETRSTYKNESIDFIELRDILSKINGKFLLSLNDSPNIRELFKNFTILSVYRNSQGKRKTIGIRARNEVFIYNY